MVGLSDDPGKREKWESVYNKCDGTLITTAALIDCIVKPEIRSVERGICPIATLYSLAAECQRLTLL